MAQFKITVYDANGLQKTSATVSSLATTALTGTLQAAQEPAHTGDVTNSAGSLAMTLATVNSNVGSFALANITVNAKGLITAASATALPISAQFWHHQATVIAGNALAIIVDATYLFNGNATQNTAAQNDAFTQTFWMKAGTYTLYCLWGTGTNRGQIQWYIDNTAQGSAQEWYAASGAQNVLKSVSVTVVGDGVHTLKGILATKHASSSGYYFTVGSYWIQ